MTRVTYTILRVGAGCRSAGSCSITLALITRNNFQEFTPGGKFVGFVTLARVDHKLFTLAGVDSQKRGNSNFFYSGGGGG